MKYQRKVRETVDAIQFTGQNARDIAEWMNNLGEKMYFIDRGGRMVITAPNGPIIVKTGYYILFDLHDGYMQVSSIDFERDWELELIPI